MQGNEPSEFFAYVTHGVLHWKGREVTLPFIRGKGSFKAQYLGDTLRIFETDKGALAVQVRQDLILRARE